MNRPTDSLVITFLLVLRAWVRPTECNLARDDARSGPIDRRIEPPEDTPDSREYGRCLR